MAVQAERGVPFSTLSPKFLHSNSTSHTWPFSAIAELIDNAYDPDVSAKQFWIDKTVVKGQECLTFMDNGNGLDNETMHKMLSFGYSDKAVVNGQQPIGIYGNGFKSGSMRLGKDAIVFSKSKNSSCVGMLSQTYLEKINANQIIVPIVCFERSKTNQCFVREEHKASLQDILQYSPFKTQQELLDEIDNLISSLFQAKTGTRIIIWNLRRTSSGSTEFDCLTDRYDIRIPQEVYATMNDPSQHSDRVHSYTPDTMFSLRAYCSILYLKPRMQIMVRGQKVKSQLIAKSLAHVKKDFYKPQFLDNKAIKITFGYNPRSKDQYGIMMYHKNRLIKAYERVGCQLKADRKGVGVIGVIPCDFLEPTHNKQNFLESDKYRKTMLNLATKLEDYCNEIRYRKTKENPNSTIPVEDTMKRPDQNWVQCDKCLQWRKLPDGIDCNKLPDKWFCHMNPDPQFRSCLAKEEAEDSDDDRPYQKTYKLQWVAQHQEREARIKLENDLQKAEEMRKNQEAQRLAKLHRQTEDLRRQHQNLQQELRKTPGSSSSTPTTPNVRPLQGNTLRASTAPRIISALSQSACNPSSKSGLPVISNVRSLSATPQSAKRTLPVPAQPVSKRLRLNGLNSRASDNPSTANVSSITPLSLEILSDSDDDEIVILENISSPKPKQPVVDSKKVKKEKEESEASISMLLECSDDAAVDHPSESNAAGKDSSVSAGTSPSTALHTDMASTTTQTESPKIKQEKLSQNPKTTEDARAKSSTENATPNLNACDAGEREFKQESNGDSQSGNQGQQTLQNGNAKPSSSNNCDDTQSPLHCQSVAEVQEQQDQLLELMQDTAQERDDFKGKVHQLTCELHDAQRQLDELRHANIKKECLHQASQTEEEEEEEGNYKSLFEKAKQKVDELIRDKEALIAEREGREELSSAQGERDSDEVALEVDRLIRDLEQSNKEKEELRSQLDDLKVQKVDLERQCEELRRSLQQQSETTSSRPTSNEASGQEHQEDEGGIGTSSSNSSTTTSRSLIELRHNIGRLLISHVPALDLEQVNFECNVIDEILEQVVSNRDANSESQ